LSTADVKHRFRLDALVDIVPVSVTAAASTGSPIREIARREFVSTLVTVLG